MSLAEEREVRASPEGAASSSSSSSRPSTEEVASREDDFIYYLHRGSELLQSRRPEDARVALERAFHLSPQNPKAQNLLGLVYFKLGLLEAAKSIYDRLVEEYPSEPPLYVNLGLVLLRQGRLNEAERSLRKAISIAPEHVRAHCYLGLVLYRRGDLALAREHFLKGQAEDFARKVEMKLSQTGGARPSQAELLSEVAAHGFRNLDSHAMPFQPLDYARDERVVRDEEAWEALVTHDRPADRNTALGFDATSLLPVWALTPLPTPAEDPPAIDSRPRPEAREPAQPAIAAVERVESESAAAVKARALADTNPGLTSPWNEPTPVRPPPEPIADPWRDDGKTPHLDVVDHTRSAIAELKRFPLRALEATPPLGMPMMLTPASTPVPSVQLPTMQLPSMQLPSMQLPSMPGAKTSADFGEHDRERGQRTDPVSPRSAHFDERDRERGDRTDPPAPPAAKMAYEASPASAHDRSSAASAHDRASPSERSTAVAVSATVPAGPAQAAARPVAAPVPVPSPRSASDELTARSDLPEAVLFGDAGPSTQDLLGSPREDATAPTGVPRLPADSVRPSTPPGFYAGPGSRARLIIDERAYLKASSIVAASGRLDMTPAMSQLQGRSTGTPFGDPADPMCLLEGRAVLLLRVPRIAVALRGVRDLHVVQSALVGFDSAFHWDNGKILGMDVVTLRGTGSLLLDTRGAPMLIPVDTETPVHAARSAILAWSDGVRPSPVDGGNGEARLFRLRGRGYVLVAFPPESASGSITTRGGR